MGWQYTLTNKQYIEQHNRHKQYTEQHNNFSTYTYLAMYWAPPRNYYTPDISIGKCRDINYPVPIILLNAHVFCKFLPLLLQKTRDNLTLNQTTEILPNNHQMSIEKLQKYATHCSTFSLTVSRCLCYIYTRPPTTNTSYLLRYTFHYLQYHCYLLHGEESFLRS